MSENGIIRNEDYFKQGLLFEGLTWGKMSFTDIDACIEFKGKLFVFVEVKFGNAPLPTGQKILLERLVDNLRVDALAMVCRHRQTQDIKLASCVVHLVYDGKWHNYGGRGLTVKRAIDRLIKKYKIQD